MTTRSPKRRNLRGDEGGVSIIEFALILPALLILMLGGFQLILFVEASRRVSSVGNSISQMITQIAPPPGSSVATAKQSDVRFAYDATMVLFPYLLQDSKRKNIAWDQNISINVASIQFTKQLPTCPAGTDMSVCYKANVVWTSTGSFGGKYRPCNQQQMAADDTATPTRTTLPRSLFGPGSVIAVDISFTFIPTFGAQLLPTIEITRSAFLQPRYADSIGLETTSNSGLASTCV